MIKGAAKLQMRITPLLLGCFIFGSVVGFVVYKMFPRTYTFEARMLLSEGSYLSKQNFNEFMNETQKVIKAPRAIKARNALLANYFQEGSKGGDSGESVSKVSSDSDVIFDAEVLLPNRILFKFASRKKGHLAVVENRTDEIISEYVSALFASYILNKVEYLEGRRASLRSEVDLFKKMHRSVFDSTPYRNEFYKILRENRVLLKDVDLALSHAPLALVGSSKSLFGAIESSNSGRFSLGNFDSLLSVVAAYNSAIESRFFAGGSDAAKFSALRQQISSFSSRLGEKVREESNLFKQIDPLQGALFRFDMQARWWQRISNDLSSAGPKIELAADPSSQVKPSLRSAFVFVAAGGFVGVAFAFLLLSVRSYVKPGYLDAIESPISNLS